MRPQHIPAVGGISHTDLSPVSHLLNAPTRTLTWLTILKASVAVAVAWQIASALPGDDAPVFAPIVALTTVQSSLYGTFAQGFQTAAGNIIGVALATGLVNVAGRTAVALFVATFVGLAVSRRLPIGSGARGQITFSMILVVALGPTSGYATARLLDCAIGGAIGILVALVVPESPQIEPVRTAISGWA
ncbi:MAG TPA: aromatic acid exporter family protein, partial [Microlunatus sp.]